MNLVPKDFYNDFSRMIDEAGWHIFMYKAENHLIGNLILFLNAKYLKVNIMF